MKKLFVLVSVVAFALVVSSCKKKDSAGKAGASAKESAAQAAASVEKELGIKPKVHVEVNMASVKGSPLYDMFKDKIEAQIGKDECAKKVMETLDSVIILGSPEALGGRKDGGENKNENICVVLKTADAKGAMECIKKSNEDIKEGKLNGADVLTFEKDGQKGYFWQSSDKTVTMVGGPWAEKVTPGKGAVGKGEIPSLGSGKSVTFSVQEMDEVKEASGIVDLAKGLFADVTVTFKNEGTAKEAEEQFQEAKKQADQIPIPGVGDIIKSVKFSRNGAAISVQVTISVDQLKQLAGMAKGLGGGLPM